MSFGLRLVALSVATCLSLGGISLGAETVMNASHGTGAVQDAVAVDAADVDSVIAAANAAGQGTVPGAGSDADAFAVSETSSASSKSTSKSTSEKTSDVTAQQLPDSVDASIPDDATLVSPDLAVTKQGEVKDVKTGETVTDPSVVGTQDTPPDPLDKTDGKSYIPVAVSDVKAEVGVSDSGVKKAEKSQNSADAAAFVEGQSQVVAAAQGNQWGAYWGTYNGSQAFFEKDRTLFAQNAKWVVDVSKHNGTINWQRVKNAGVQGAIIRVGYGADNPIDQQAIRNIHECKRLRIPFGVYLYSYADSVSMAQREGESVVGYLRQAGVSPSDLSYPVYYDMEHWSWTGHSPSSNPSVNASYAQAFWRALEKAGFGGRIAIYSYTSYLNSALNSQWIHDRTDWVAQYSGRITYKGWAANASRRAWQYTSSGHIDGIGTAVDMNAFGVQKSKYSTSGSIAQFASSHRWVGNPANNMLTVRGGWSQTFDNATVFAGRGVGTHAVKGAIRDKYASLRWEQGPLGWPSSEERSLRNGASQSFSSGKQIHWSPSAGAHVTGGDIQNYWASAGWENGRLGYPTRDEIAVRGGASQTFQRGTLFWSASTRTHEVRDGIHAEYAASGYEQGKLGFPVSDERRLSRNGGASQVFQHGQIHWSAATGAHLTTGAIQNYWESQGWENGWLGYLTSGEINDPAKRGEVYQNYQGGQIHWRSWNGTIYTTRW